MKHNYLKHLFTAMLLLCATVATAHDFEVDGIYYNILSEEDKTVEVTYKGTSYNQYSNEYTGSVIIPQSVTYNGTVYSVTSIGKYAFYLCDSLASIEIPSSVTNIGARAFYYCSKLKRVVIGNSVTYIGDYAFTGCPITTVINFSSLKFSKGSSENGDVSYHANRVINAPNGSKEGDFIFGKQNDVNTLLYYIGNASELTLPADYKGENYAIGDDVFYNYSSKLTSIEIPNSVISIGKWAFHNCTGLTNIEIPSSVMSIEEGAFSYCNALKSLEIGDGVQYIGDEAFYDCSGLTCVVIPNSVTSIGKAAFSKCKGFRSIVLGDGITSIGNLAFSDCSSLTSIEIPNSVTSIGDYAFSGCTGLTSIKSHIPTDKLFAISSSLFYGVDKTNCTLYVPYGAKETYVATEGWKNFKNIVELEKTITDVTVAINQYGCATYCSPYALDFSEVEGLKAYSAIGYKPSTQVVTLARVMTTGAGQGVFIKGEPGEYIVPVIDDFDEYTLNMLVGTLEQTVVNSTEGEMSNYKFTIADGDAAPMFYPFEDNTTFSAGKAYLQIPTAWLPATAQKSLSVRFDDGETTDIDELKGESGEVKTIYDLQGRVVENPTSGIYIIDGKKVLIK